MRKIDPKKEANVIYTILSISTLIVGIGYVVYLAATLILAALNVTKGIM
jgi:hypothetical protein